MLHSAYFSYTIIQISRCKNMLALCQVRFRGCNVDLSHFLEWCLGLEQVQNAILSPLASDLDLWTRAIFEMKLDWNGKSWRMEFELKNFFIFLLIIFIQIDQSEATYLEVGTIFGGAIKWPYWFYLECQLETRYFGTT